MDGIQKAIQQKASSVASEQGGCSPSYDSDTTRACPSTMTKDDCSGRGSADASIPQGPSSRAE